MMAKKYVIFLIANLITLYSFGRHCPWDGSNFIMLDAKGSPSVNLQKIYLLDLGGKIVTSKRYFGDSAEIDTARFWKNHPKMQCKILLNTINNIFLLRKITRFLNSGNINKKWTIVSSYYIHQAIKQGEKKLLFQGMTYMYSVHWIKIFGVEKKNQ